VSSVPWDECLRRLGMTVGSVVEDGGAAEMAETGGGRVGTSRCCMVGGAVVGGGIGTEGVASRLAVA